MALVSGTIALLMLGILLLALCERKMSRGYSRLQDAGLASSSPLLTALRICGWLMLLGGLSLGIWETRGQNRQNSNQTRFLVLLDCSRSMLAQSVPGTSRLEQAKEAARQLQSEHYYAEWGLISSGGVALTDLLPTCDSQAFLDAMEDAQPSSLLGQGTAWSSAWQQAEALSRDATGHTVVLLFTDGELNLADFGPEEDSWRSRSLPCLLLLCGEEGVAQPVPGSSVQDAASTPTAESLRRLLGLSTAPWRACWLNTGAASLSRQLDILLSEGMRQTHSSFISAWSWLVLLGILLLLLDATKFARKLLRPALTVCLGLLAVSTKAAELTPRQVLEQQLLKLAESPAGDYAPEALTELANTARLVLHLQPNDEEIAACLEWCLLQQESLMASSEEGAQEKQDAPSMDTQSDETEGNTSAMPGGVLETDTATAQPKTADPAGKRPQSWRKFLEQQPEVKKARQPFPDW
jgi:hypothetical protein